MTEEQTTLTFSDLGLNPQLISAIERLGYKDPTPIQAAAIPVLLEGHDVIGGARTGSGKTAAFGLPMLHRIGNNPEGVKGLILAPTRELALQVTDALRTFAHDMRIKITTIYGGASYDRQLRALRAGVGIVVGTPGRIIDLLDRGALKLDDVEFAVLDEADEMLRMGFIDDVAKILSRTPDTRQTALFSATMPEPIRKIANTHLKDPQTLQVESSALSVDHIKQYWINVPHRHKLDALVRILDNEERGATLIFARTRAGCAEVADALAKRGMPSDALHGDLNQAARERVLSRLRSKRLDVVVATDIAARGIDVDHITHVINLDFPHDSEIYVHRIGRTGRAGREGTAIILVTPREQRRLRFLQKDVGVKIERMKIPSDADIIARKRKRLATRLTELCANDELTAERAFVAEMIDAGTPLEDIAAAALRGFSKSVSVDLGRVATDEAPKWMKAAVPRDDGRPLGPKGYRDLGEEREIFVSVGRQHGVRPSDLVGAIANEAGIRGSDIGRITVLERKSFVSLPVAIAEKIMQRFDAIEVRGVRADLRMARPRGANGPGDVATSGPRPRVHEQGREVFLPIGTKQRIRDRDILRAVAKAAGIQEDDVGKITVLGGKSFVRLPNKVAASLLASHATIAIRGMEVPITPARPRQDQPQHGGRPHRQFKKYGKGHRKGFKKRR